MTSRVRLHTVSMLRLEGRHLLLQCSTGVLHFPDVYTQGLALVLGRFHVLLIILRDAHSTARPPVLLQPVAKLAKLRLACILLAVQRPVL